MRSDARTADPPTVPAVGLRLPLRHRDDPGVQTDLNWADHGVDLPAGLEIQWLGGSASAAHLLALHGIADHHDDFFRPVETDMGFSLNVDLGAFADAVAAVAPGLPVRTLDPLQTVSIARVCSPRPDRGTLAPGSGLGARPPWGHASTGRAP